MPFTRRTEAAAPVVEKLKPMLILRSSFKKSGPVSRSLMTASLLSFSFERCILQKFSKLISIEVPMQVILMPVKAADWKARV